MYLELNYFIALSTRDSTNMKLNNSSDLKASKQIIFMGKKYISQSKPIQYIMSMPKSTLRIKGLSQLG